MLSFFYAGPGEYDCDEYDLIQSNSSHLGLD